MIRLTKKVEKNRYIIECPSSDNCIDRRNQSRQLRKILYSQNKGIQKLGKLEDIEEELGISLITYHRIMNMLYCGEPENNVYIREGNSIIEVHILEIDYCKKKIIFYKDNWEDEADEYVYGFYQYDELWALTKEELE